MSEVIRPILRLSDKQSQAWRDLDDPSVLEVFAGGGAGGGKSWLGCMRQIDRRLRYAGTRGFIGRESFTGLRDSTMNTFFELVRHMGYSGIDHYTYNAQEHNVYWKVNGSETHFRHMAYMPSDPDYNRFGSTEYTDGFVDEAPEVKARACQVLLSRLRYRHGEHGITPELLYTGNPGESWIKDQFVMDPSGALIDLPIHRRRVLFTIRDNPNKALRDNYEKTLGYLDAYDRARLLDGDWTAKPSVERPFAHLFDQTKHVRNAAARPHDIHFVSVDFNVDPFCAIVGHIWTDSQGDHLHITGEISIKEGTVRAMASRILALCPARHLIQLTGDRNGRARRLGTTDNMPLFEELRRELGIGPRQVLVLPNPTHLLSREEVNLVLAEHPDLRIAPACTGLIRDLLTVEIDGDGKIVKDDRTQANKQADLLDCFRYLLHTRLSTWIKRRRNELQRHPHGLRPQPLRGQRSASGAELGAGLGQL